MSSIGRSLRRQLLAGLLLALAVSGLSVWLIVRRALIAQFDAALLAKARLFGAIIQEEPGEGIILELDETPMPEFERRDNPEYFQVWLSDDTVLARSVSLGKDNLTPPARTGSAPVLWDLTLASGRPGRAVTLTSTVRWDDEVGGQKAPPRLPLVRLALAIERTSLDAALVATSEALAAGGLLLLMGVPLLVGRAVRRGLRPLDEVAGQAARIDARSLGRRFATEEVPEELRPICGRLNDLLERLEGSFDRERRFTADVAHELRTPIAELRSIAEVALRFPETTGAAGRNFEDVLGATVHMQALVTTLLTLARCESGRQPVSIEPVDLGRICQEVWAVHERVANDRGVRVVPGSTALVTVDSDPVLVGSVIANLVSNAVEYTPVGGEVTWRIEQEAGQGVFIITNSNASLETGDLPHVFERFWRKDDARTGATHGGLGLSLAEAFVCLMGGQLRVELPRPDLVRVELRLPTRRLLSRDHASVMYAS